MSTSSVAAVMQPYFFPYIGYFQLLRAADTFVVLDDVQYIERGWVNRNRVLIGSEAKWLTFPVVNAPRFLAINERSYRASAEDRETILKTVTKAYRKAPY